MGQADAVPLPAQRDERRARGAGSSRVSGDRLLLKCSRCSFLMRDDISPTSRSFVTRPHASERIEPLRAKSLNQACLHSLGFEHGRIAGMVDNLRAHDASGTIVQHVGLSATIRDSHCRPHQPIATRFGNVR